jgi:hypothetical protein
MEASGVSLAKRVNNVGIVFSNSKGMMAWDECMQKQNYFFFSKAVLLIKSINS